jgi:hypothetical protein
MAAKGGGAPSSAAEGLGNILRAITDTMQAPDAVSVAGPLMHLQTTVLDMIHGAMKQGQPQGGAAPAGGAPPGGAPPGAAPGGPPPGGGGLGGGLTGMMGQAQGPSKAVSGSGPSLSGMDPESIRQMALSSADSDES